MGMGPTFQNDVVPISPGAKIGDASEAQRNPLQTLLNPPGPIWDAVPRALAWRPETGGAVTWQATYETPVFDLSPQLMSFAGQNAEAVPVWLPRGSGVSFKLQIQTLAPIKLTDLYLSCVERGHIRDVSQVAFLGPAVDITQDMQGGGRAYIAIFEPPGMPYSIRFYQIKLFFTIRGTAVTRPPALFVCGAAT